MKDSGIPCPVCSAGSNVRETRLTPSGLRRRRICLNAHKFTTHEIVVGDGQRRDHRMVLIPRADVDRMMKTLHEAIPASETTGAKP